MSHFAPRRPRRSGAPHHTSPAPSVRPLAPPPSNRPIVLPEAFTALGLSPKLVRAIGDEGYTQPSPVQLQAIPPGLEGRDLLACAQTGTGKTAAFVLPILQRLEQSRNAQTPHNRIRALVLTPTRELAAQIGERTAAYGRYIGLRHTTIYGGVGQRPQEVALRGNLDIVIATPGRLMDLMEQGHVKLGGVECFVLDEADRMLDMGFLPDVRRIAAALPAVRQTLLFSATMPSAIAALAQSLLRNPARVSITPTVTTAEKIDQVLYHVSRNEKRALLETLLRKPEMTRTLVFTRTKRGADRLFEQLERSGIGAAVIHGNKSQGARQRALGDFAGGRASILIATDVAARGIDVDAISHVVNYDLPDVAESYVHRIGRTGRAGASGRAISFCDVEERDLLREVERFIKAKIPLAEGQTAPPERAHASSSRPHAPSNGARPSFQKRGGGGGGGGQRRSRGGRPTSRQGIYG